MLLNFVNAFRHLGALHHILSIAVPTSQPIKQAPLFIKGVAMSPYRFLFLLVCLVFIRGQFAFPQPPAEEGRKGPEPTKTSRTDLLGDPLPAGGIVRLGKSQPWLTLVRHRAFSPDAARLVVLDEIHSHPVLRMCDVKTGSELWKVQLPGSEDARVIPWPVFSPDGKVIAIGCPDKTVRLWDTATGKERGHLAGHEGFVTLAAFSPDGKVLATVGGNKTIRLWDVGAGKEQRLIREERGDLRAVAFSADGKMLVAMRSTFRLPDTLIWTASEWDVATGNERPGKTFELENSSYYCPLSSDAQYFATVSADGKSIRLLEPMSGKELRRTDDVASRLSYAVFSADGRSMTVIDSRDGKVRVWDVSTCKLRYQFSTLSGGVYGIALSHDGGLLALNSSGHPTCTHIYDVARGKDIHEFPGHRGRPLTVAFARDGKTVITLDPPAFSQPVGAWDPWAFCVWDAATGKLLRATSVDPRGEVRLALVSPDSRLIATVLHDGTIRLWDVTTGKEVQHWKGPTREVKWQSGNESKTADYTSVQQAVFSPDGKILMAPGRDGLILRWDTATGKALPSLKAPFSVARVFPAPDGRTLLASTHDKSVEPRTVYPLVLLDATSGRLVRRMESPEKDAVVTPAIASPDSRTWAVMTWLDGRPKVVLLEAATGRKRGRLDPSGGVTALAFSPDSRVLAIAGKELSLWDLASGRRVGQVVVPGGADVTSLAFSPDGKRLAVAGGDSAGSIYNVAELAKAKVPAPGNLSPADLDGLWKDLSEDDAARAYQSVHRLAAAPQGVTFLKERLTQPPSADEKRLSQLLADLDNSDFELREKATRELENLRRQAEPALRAVLEGKPSAEVRARIEGLLKKLTSADMIALRALEALETAGTPEARQVIKGLAAGASAAPLTEAAKAAWGRLAARGVPR